MSRQTCALNNFKLRDNPQIDVSGRGFLRDDPSVWWHQTLAPENLGSNLWRKSPTLLLPRILTAKSRPQKHIVGAALPGRPSLESCSPLIRLGWTRSAALQPGAQFLLIGRHLDKFVNDFWKNAKRCLYLFFGVVTTN